MATSLEKQAEDKNMSVQHKKNAGDRHKCCLQNYKCCQSGFWYEIIQNSKNKTRSKWIQLQDCIKRVELCMFLNYFLMFHEHEHKNHIS